MRKRVSEEVYDADPADLLEFGEAWARLGSSVQGQVSDLLNNNKTCDDLNQSAIALAVERIGGFNGQMDEALEKCIVGDEDVDADE